jgi:hypothetical protein
VVLAADGYDGPPPSRKGTGFRRKINYPKVGIV